MAQRFSTQLSTPNSRSTINHSHYAAKLSYKARLFWLIASLSVTNTLLAEDETSQGAPPPTPATVWTTKQATISRDLTLPARAQAISDVKIRSRATGILLKQHFEEGAWINKGDLLFQLEPDILEASIRSMEASLRKADSDVKIAKQTLDRVVRLQKQRMVSEEQLDQAKADYHTAIAEQGIAKANLERAQLDLHFANIYSPTSGYAGFTAYNEGDLVKLDDEGAMVTITQVDPIWVIFSVPGRLLNSWLQMYPQLDLAQLPITLQPIPNASDRNQPPNHHPHPGKIVFSDHHISPTNGGILFRAEFPNPDRTLKPGQYMNVTLTFKVPNVLAIPQQSVNFTDQGAAVWLVGKDNTVSPQPVQLGAMIGDQWVVKQGLDHDAKIIYSGIQKIMPGMTIEPIPYQSNP